MKTASVFRASFIVVLIAFATTGLLPLTAEAQAPTIGTVDPNSGPIWGGTAITINGSNFQTGATVTIGGNPATGVVVTPGVLSTIDAVTPAGTAGAADVVVTNPDMQTAALTDGFTYISPAPSISTVVPNSGPPEGGTAITINGQNFQTGATVTIGGNPATGIVVTPGALSTIDAVTPAGTVGAADVVVTNPDAQTANLVDGFTYAAAPGPIIGSIDPAAGPSWGSTSITINGSYFQTGVSVTIGGTPATVNNVVNPGGLLSQIDAVTPAGAVGPADVVVTNPDTQSYTLAGGFTYHGPSINSIVPDDGPSWGSTEVTINGSYFHSGVSVTIGGTAASVNNVVNPGGLLSQIDAVTPAGAPGPADVVVTNPDTYSYTRPGGFTYHGPSINSIVPDSGPSWGGTNVTINGSYFHSGVSVTIGGASASVNNVVNPGGLLSQIEAVSPPGAPGAADVVVTNPDTYSYMLADGFTYLGPSIVSVVPNSGPVSGGTDITINGQNFQDGATVTIGGNPATGVVVTPGALMSQIAAVTPAGTAGPADVVVTNPDAHSATLVDGFTYVAPPAPTIASIDPNSGPVSGGTSIRINGQNFQTGATVTIGGNPATGVVVTPGALSTIDAVTPAGSAGPADVVVTNPDAQSDTLVDGFTYVAAPAPTIGSVDPNSGPVSGGTSITINGSNFQSGATVTIGGNPATGVVVTPGVLSTIGAVTPAGTEGAADVVVTNPDAQSDTLVDGFTYVAAAAPTISSVDPNTGPVSGGTSITINGQDFQTGATVTIGGNPATGVVVTPGALLSQIAAVTPAGSAGPADVVVTNPDAQSDTLVDGFTYVAGVAPTISSIVPNTGPASGGTSVTINGQNFQTGATVTIGGNPATGIVVTPGALSQIAAVTPAGSPGPADVVVTNPDMQSGTLVAGFTYVSVTTAQWTFMVYLDGDNNIEGDGIDDFLEMAQVGSSSDLNIIVQMDRILYPDPSWDDTSYGDWTGTKRFRVTPGMEPWPASALQDLGEVNMGNPQTLVDFVNWATTTYPADRYALVLWNHGGGWRSRGGERGILPLRDVCYDETDYDYLSTQEVRQALESVEGSLGAGVDLVGFDACLMGMIEVAHEIRDVGNVMVASQESEPGCGWPYDTVLGDLAGDPSMTAAILGTAIVDRYYESVGWLGGLTQAAIDVTKIEELASRVDVFAQALIEHWDDDQAAVLDAAQLVMTQIDQAVIAERHGEEWWPGSHGLAIYFPDTWNIFDPSYTGATILFAADTHWDEFLAEFNSTMQDSWVGDARALTQFYGAYYNEHVDLYDFCAKLGDFADIDGDGLSHTEETTLGTDPEDPDTDEDGLNDGDEVNVYDTDPIDADSDDDTLPDGWEVFNGLDPDSGAGDDGADGDPDGDGYTNAEEYAGGSDPQDDSSVPGDLVWSTFVGGAFDDAAYDVAVDAAGAVYVTGWTASRDFPTEAGLVDSSLSGDTDAFVVKLSADGTTLVYASYLGGSGDDEGRCIVVDSAGSASVGGATSSADFPTTTGGDRTFGGVTDGFITVLSPAGSARLFSTYVGGSDYDSVERIALNITESSVYAVGSTSSTDLPVSADAMYDTLYGGFDAFVGRFRADAALTYFGGGGDDYAYGIAVGALGDATVVGVTTSDDLPTSSDAPYQSLGGGSDAFVARLNSDCSDLLYSTYLGGSSDESAADIALDAQGSLYVVGSTMSADFPVTANVVQRTLKGVENAFVTKFAANGASLTYSTYLGGASTDRATAVTLDSAGMVYVTGQAASADFPKTVDGFDAVLGGSSDAFLTVLSSRARKLVYSTYLGGIDDETGAAIVVDDAGYGLVCGSTGSNNFPITAGTFDESYNGNQDGYVTVFDLSTLNDPDSAVVARSGGHSENGLEKLNPCFIATAAYGTSGSDQVQMLLRFRDTCLLTNRAGRAFARAYYRVSPPVARFIEGRPFVKNVVRAALAPVVALARIALRSPAVFWTACVFVAGGLLWLVVLALARASGVRAG